MTALSEAQRAAIAKRAAACAQATAAAVPLPLSAAWAGCAGAAVALYAGTPAALPNGRSPLPPPLTTSAPPLRQRYRG